ncbi:MAG: DUF748 domain-containing protein [Desulfopila sp.]|nr:DUF748 domain-containing protein [Desulfopila sp.]
MADLYGNITISDEKKAAQPQPPSKQPPPPKSPPRGDDRRIKKRYILIPLCILAIAAGYYGLTILAPLYIKDTFPETFHNRTGLLLNMEEVRFDPLQCSLNLTGVVIREEKNDGSQEDFLTVREIYADLDFISLLRHGIVSDSLRVQGAHFTLFRYSDGSYNISRFFAKPGDSPKEMLNFAELPFLYSLNNISISESSILFQDISAEKVHKVENLTINLPTLSNFSFDAGSYIQPRFSAVINGSPIEMISETEGSSAFKAGESPTKLSSTLNSLDVSLYSNYLPIPLPVQIEKGEADAKIDISFLPRGAKGLQLLLNYQLQISDSVWKSRDGSLSLAAPTINIVGSLDPVQSNVHIKSLLLRDPLLSFDSAFSKETVDTLFLQDYDKNETDTIPLDLPALSLDLLIADNGKVRFATEEKDLVFSSVQLSVRNFANIQALRRNSPPPDSSFQISGELENSFSLFSWRGAFENTIPSGNIEINNLPVAMALQAIAPQEDIEARGTTDIRGKLVLRRAESAPVSFSFEQGDVRFTSIALGKKETPWLTGPSGRLSGVFFQDKNIVIDGFFLENGTLRLSPQHLPPLLQTFVESNESSIANIDFKGRLSLLPEDEKKQAVDFNTVHLQTVGLATSLPKANNFTFSGTLPNSGSLKAKGKLALSPLDGTIETAFVNLPALIFLEDQSEAFVSAGPETLLSGTGTYDISAKRYEGAVEIENGRFRYGADKRRFDFAQAAFAQLSTDGGPANISCKNVIFKKVLMEGNGYDLHAEGLSLSSLTRKDDDFAIGDLAFSGANLSSRVSLAKIFDPLVEKRTGRFKLDSFKLNGRIAFLQDPPQDAISIDDFNLHVSAINGNGSTAGTRSDVNGALSFTALQTDSIDVAGNGALALFPLQTRLNLTISETDSDIFLRLLRSESKDKLKAVVDGKITYSYPEKITAGKIALTDGRYRHADNTLTTWNKALLDDVVFQAESSLLKIDRLTLLQPNFSPLNGDSSLYRNIKSALFPASEEESPSSETLFENLEIGYLTLQEGQLQYRDERMTPPWQAELSSLEGTITNFHHSPAQLAMDYSLRGTMAGAPFSVQGSARGEEEAITETVSFELNRLPLAALRDQLSVHFDLQTDSTLLDMYYQEDASAGPSLAAFSLTSASAAAPDSPTALTIALLSDRKDHFKESVLLQDPDKTVFTQAVNHFQKLIIKSSVSPYLLLPDPYTSLRENNTIEFLPGKAELSDEGRATLSLFGMLLSEHPLLKLIPTMRIDPVLDGESLRRDLEDKENERVRQENNRLLLQWQQERAEKERTQNTNESIVEGIVEKDLQEFTPITAEVVEVEDSMLERLGRERLNVVLQFLRNEHGITPNNIASARGIEKEEGNSGIHLRLSHIGAANE